LLFLVVLLILASTPMKYFEILEIAYNDVCKFNSL
jgi:hypothetical protein